MNQMLTLLIIAVAIMGFLLLWAMASTGENE